MFADSRFIRWTAIVSLFLVAVLVGMIFWRIAPIAQERSFIPIHYNVYLGVDQFGSWLSLFSIPATGFIFFIVNLYLQVSFYTKRKQISDILAFATLLLLIVLCIAEFFIILMNL